VEKPERQRRRSGADGSRCPREFSFVRGVGLEDEITDAVVHRGVADWPLHVSSERFEPFQDRCVRAPQCEPGGDGIEGSRLLDGLPLHLEIDGRVSVRRGHTGVTKPLTDRDDVDARSERVDGGTVTTIPPAK
jgi:hypothetical protein